MTTEFNAIYERLRGILVKRAGALSVAEEPGQRYCLEGQVGPAALRAWGGNVKRATIPVAWVEVGKGYVSFHLMPIYSDPQLRAGLSPGLEKRMQGKSCFNFKVADEALFGELENLTARGFEAFKQAGFIG